MWKAKKMVWQKIVKVEDERYVLVENKCGKQYSVFKADGTGAVRIRLKMGQELYLLVNFADRAQATGTKVRSKQQLEETSWSEF